VPKISGAMIDRINLRNTLLTGANFTANAGAAMPSAMPAAMPMKIQAASDSRFTARPT